MSISLFIVMYDIGNVDSFLKVENCLSKGKFEDKMIILIGNKCDNQ